MQRQTLKKILTTALVLAGIVVMNNFVLNHFIQNLIYKAAAKPGNFFGEELGRFSKFATGIFRTGSIISENDELREQNDKLLGQIAELEGLKRENQFLRNELGVSRRLNSQLLIAEIFSIQKNTLSSTALINKGKSDGIKKSMGVITSGNILVGTVSEVYDNSSLIVLLDDPRSVVSIRFQGTNILAEAKGGLQNNLKVDMVTYQENINKEDILITSGLDGLSESLLVGRVEEIKSGSGGLFREIRAKSIFDLSSGAELFVVLK